MRMKKNDKCKIEVRGTNVERPSLVGTAGEFKGQIIELGAKIRLGRHPQNDLCLSDPTVSAFHTQITAVGDNYEIMDLRSKNRSKLNGKRLHRPVFLANNDLIEIGKNSFRFRIPRSVGRADSTCTPDSKSDVKFQSLNESIPTHKAQEHNVTSPKCADVQGDLKEDFVKVIAKRASESESEMNRRKPKRARRTITNITMYKLVAFVGFLIIAGPIVMRFVINMSPTALKKNAVSESKSRWDHQSRLVLLQRIWEKWESEFSEKEPDISDINSFLNNSLMQADQMRLRAPSVQWQFYKTCLRIARAIKDEPKDSEYIKQVEQLLLRVKIEIEDQEQLYSKLLQEAKETGEGSNAAEILQHIKDLLDLEHDNRESELAHLYCDLEQEIKQTQEINAGS
jgi:pSer/pThr/pTyr-binding forkhead associated (FHA) protein